MLSRARATACTATAGTAGLAVAMYKEQAYATRRMVVPNMRGSFAVLRVTGHLVSVRSNARNRRVTLCVKDGDKSRTNCKAMACGEIEGGRIGKFERHTCVRWTFAAAKSLQRLFTLAPYRNAAARSTFWPVPPPLKGHRRRA
eukprot:scaffold54524_cov38-Tisochrysis_lutea.AAC.1